MNKWKNISDENLDRMFRESADRDLPEFDENAWDQMNNLLDKEDDKKPAFWYQKKLLLLILLFTGITFVFTYRYFIIKDSKNIGPAFETKDINNVKQNNFQKELTNSDSKKNPIDNKKALGTNKDLTAEIAEITHNTDNQAIVLESNKLTRITRDKKIIIKSDDPLKPETNQGLNEYEKKNNKDMLNKNSTNLISELHQTNKALEIDHSNFRQKKSALAEVKKPGTSIEDIIISEKDNSFPIFDNVVEISGYVFQIIPASFKAPDSDFKNVPSLLNPKHKSSNFDQGKIGIRLGYSPDLSTIANNRIGRIGSDFEILAEYRFTKKWSLGAGVIKSLKYYDARSSQYAWPAKWSAVDQLKLLKIKAECDMLDIPLNLRYDFNNNQKMRWFASAGVTSYVMLNEKYNYIYESDYQPVSNKYSWQGKTGFYKLGVVNLSGGLEYNLKNKISLQAEPFIKIPVEEVGYGYVKLLTAGIFISGKYTIN